MIEAYMDLLQNTRALFSAQLHCPALQAGAQSDVGEAGRAAEATSVSHLLRNVMLAALQSASLHALKSRHVCGVFQRPIT